MKEYYRNNKTKVFYMALTIILPLFFILYLNASNLSFHIIKAGRLFRFRKIIIMSYFFFLSMTTLLVLITNSYLAGNFIVAMVVLILGVANAMKISYRLEPVFPYELFYFGAVFDILEMITKQEAFIISALFLFIIVGAVLLIKYKPMKSRVFNDRKKSIVYSSTVLVIVLFQGFLFSNYNNQGSLINKFMRGSGFKPKSYSSIQTYRENGFLPGMIYNTEGTIVEKPEGYAKETMQALVKKYEGVAQEINQSRTRDDWEGISVISVLSESFTDPLIFDTYELSHDPIPLVRQAENKYFSGHVMVPSFGGGTANSEYEALTGLPVSFLSPGMATPFQRFVSSWKHFPSHLLKFGNTSHKLISIHAHNSSMYKRKSVYTAMHFDEMYFSNNMKNKRYIDGDDIYVSDESGYQEMLDLFAENPDQDLFMNYVTMQNHTAFNKEYTVDQNMNVIFNVDVSEEATQQFKNYLDGLQISDFETDVFLKKLDALERKVVVLFYGDHLPSLYNGFKEGLDPVDLKTTYGFVYKNFDLDHKSSTEKTSLSNLQILASEAASVKVNAFEAFVQTFYTEFTGINTDTYIDAQGNALTEDMLNDYQKALILEYEYWQYDALVGPNYAQRGSKK